MSYIRKEKLSNSLYICVASRAAVRCQETIVSVGDVVRQWIYGSKIFGL